MIHFLQHRRKFLQTGVAGFCTALFSSLPKNILAKPNFKPDKGIVVHKEEGIHVLTRRKVPITVKVSKAKNGVDNISFCVEDMSPGRKMRIHKHLNNDELIFIHKGEGRLTLDEEPIDVKTGDVVFIPRNTWHGLDNTGKENLLMVFQYTPAGFEEYFIENGTLVGTQAKERTEEEYALTEKEYGMVYKDKQWKNAEIDQHKVSAPTEDSVRRGTVNFLNQSKGYGLIEEDRTQKSFFVHINSSTHQIKKNDKVLFQIEMTPGGASSVEVTLD